MLGVAYLGKNEKDGEASSKVFYYYCQFAVRNRAPKYHG
jgi:hypothetical protein